MLDASQVMITFVSKVGGSGWDFSCSCDFSFVKNSEHHFINASDI